jgi:hypothetical protein
LALFKKCKELLSWSSQELSSTSLSNKKYDKMAHHLPGIIVQIVGTEMADRGRSCEEHIKINCGVVLVEEVVAVCPKRL